MNGAAWLLALATLGVDYGWRLDGDGQLEYIIQIPPSQLETLRDSPDGVSSAIPPEVVRHVKRFRIVVGTDPLPKDPLPTFSGEGQTLGAVTPINVGASRVNPAGGEFPTVDGDFETPALESTVTPLDGGLPRAALPGPADDRGGPHDAIRDFLPLPPVPRAGAVARDQGFGADWNNLAATIPSAVIRAHDLDHGDWQPNVSAPDASDAWDQGVADAHPAGRNASYTDRSTATDNRSLGSRTLSNSAFDDPYNRPQKPWGPLMLTMCALCLSLGGNVYLGWVAWGYYLKFRESFESWRNSWSQ